MIRAHILHRFRGDEPQLVAVCARLTQVCEDFLVSGRADPTFVSKLTSGSDQAFWASLSEALIADRLHARDFLPRRRIGAGPDFLIGCNGRKVWIEVTCPEPGKVPHGWLRPPPVHSLDFPHEDILLRWIEATSIAPL